MNPHKLLPHLPRVATSADWHAYYMANAQFQLEIPWERGAEITPEQIDAIAYSLAIWQLGETSDGSHLLAAAKKYAELINEPQTIDVIYLFIKEEQRHGNLLGQFLDLAQIPRVRSNWGDTIFRAIRYSIPNIEIWSTPVIMVETIALIYYKAIQKATKSTVLYSICQQILRDEVKHIRFQYEQFAIIFRVRPLLLRILTLLIHRILYFSITLAVWVGHRKALQAGGYNFKSYWQEAWIKMNFAWRRMNPERYEWKSCSLEVQPNYK